jgi:hypothetical protein
LASNVMGIDTRHKAANFRSSLFWRIEMSTKAIIVGRHTSDLGSEAENFEIVGNENVMFSLVRSEAVQQLEQLFATAQSVGAEAILLQNVPAILAAALLDEQAKAGGQLPFRIGLIISVPGPRQAGVSEQFLVWASQSTNELGTPDVAAVEAAEAAVRFANGRAKIERSSEPVDGDWVLTITVDPVPQFQFSHIEWL